MMIRPDGLSFSILDIIQQPGISSICDEMYRFRAYKEKTKGIYKKKNTRK